MKRCPTCDKTFTDQHLSFCIDDGTPLVTVDTSSDEATLVLPSSREPGSLSPEESSRSSAPVAPYQPPGSHASTGQRPRRRAWPWVLGFLALVLLVFGGLGIAGVLLLPRIRAALSDRDSPHTNANVERRERRDNGNRNLSGTNSNSSENEGNSKSSAAQDSAPPPTNEEEVLTDLTDLEHEWTVANINADQKKLNRILADDYVGTVEGKPQGKVEYLKTIKRDTTIQKWDFEELKVSLKGDRATLTGIIRLVVQDQDVAYRFTDKFVWRDNRWQATGSEVDPL